MQVLKSLGGTLVVLAMPLHMFASLVFEGPVTFSGPASSRPTILTIQNTGTASGCVAFLSGDDVTGLAACPGGFTGAGGNEVTAPQTGTRTIAQLTAAGISSAGDLRFVFHPTEMGGPISISDLALTFFDVANDSTFTASLLGTPLVVPDTSAASASNAALAFRLDAFEAGLAADFFSNPENRVGGAATISGSTGGVATFSAAPVLERTAIPEPGTPALVSTGVFALVLLRRFSHLWTDQPSGRTFR